MSSVSTPNRCWFLPYLPTSLLPLKEACRIEHRRANRAVLQRQGAFQAVVVEGEHDVAAGGDVLQLVGDDADWRLIDRHVHLPDGERAVAGRLLEGAAVEGDDDAIDRV